MKIVSSNLSPTAWAALVLAGGCLLAIPFFKRPAEQYVGVDDIAARKSYSKAPARTESSQSVASKNRMPQASSTSSSAASSPVPIHAPVGSNQSASDQIVPEGSSHATAAGPLVPRDGAIARASIDTLPPPAIAAKRQSSGSLGRSHSVGNYLGRVDHDSVPTTVGQSDSSARTANRSHRDDTFGDVAPLHTEFPDWAKKPSLLDLVISGKDSSPSPLQTAPARKPSPFRSWTDQPDENRVEKPVETVDRYTPFGTVRENASLTSQNSASRVQWPDEDPRSALAMPKPKDRLVGRDAVIRDPALLATPQSVPSPSHAVGSGLGSRPAAVLSSGAAGEAASNDVAKLIVQPRFGQSPSDGARSAASLRRYLPPDEQMIIRQPGLD